MENVPKTVLRRLREAGPVEGHPDADLLTAFAEQSLADSERREVTEHLERCENCREVMALALPPDESVVFADAVVSRGGWLGWPVLRWGVVAAGIILVASVGVIQYQRRRQDHAVVAKDVGIQSDSALQGSLPSSQAVSSLSVPGPEASEKKMHLQKKAAATAQPDSSMTRRSALSGATPQRMRRPDTAGTMSAYGSGAGISPGNMNAFAKNQSSAPEKSNLPASSEMVEVQSEMARVNSSISQTKDQQAQAPELAGLQAVGKAKNPVPPQAQSGSAAAPAFAPVAVPPQTSPALLQRVLPRWTISPAGGLQRSFDAGRTWEDVNVIAASSGNRPEMASAARQRAVDEYKNKKSTDRNADESPVSSGLIFRVVAASGSEVWAGGSNAILYHSLDSGAGWTRVSPSQIGIVLTGDITAIEFSDLQHGRLSTSTGEVWLTLDDGQNWQKQP